MVERDDSVIIRTISRILAPYMQLFALYVIMHGHISPGGGFQGGVILGAVFILLAISFGMEEVRERLAERILTAFTSLGVFLYGFIGFLCFILGASFLDYSILPLADPRSMGMLGIEIGVGMTVMAVMVSIFYDISTFE